MGGPSKVSLELYRVGKCHIWSLNEEPVTIGRKWSPGNPRELNPGREQVAGSLRHDLLREGNTSLFVIIVSPGNNMKSGSINTVARLP